MKQEPGLNGFESEQSSFDNLAAIDDLARRLVNNTGGDSIFIEAIKQAWREGRYNEPISYGEFTENGKKVTKTRSIKELLQDASLAFSTLIKNKVGGEAKAMVHQQKVDNYQRLLNKIGD
jgi:hypothetical protein